MLIVLALAMASPAGAWKFASIADSRGDNNGVNTDELIKIVGLINAENVDLVIFGGDAVTGCDDTCLSSQMDNWVGIMNGLNCPWYYTPGNHEISTSSGQENVLRAKVVQPEDGPDGDKEMTYTFTHQNALFVALNSERYGQQHHVDRSWLTGKLANATQPHIFVYTHDPAYPAGPHIGSSLDANPGERNDFWNILTTSAVRMFFCGHEHLYQRSLQGSVYQIINGTCGAPINTGYSGTIAQYQYVIVTVNGYSVHCDARYDTGALIESWDYTHTPPTIVNCDSAKVTTNNSYVTLRDKVVTAVRGSAIYVEEDNRAAAFRATGITGISVGDRVNTTGTLQANSSGEREVQGTAMKLSSGTVPKPLGMTNRSLLGGPRGYNSGAEGGLGCNTSSLLVRVFGEVTSIGAGPNAGMFYIDDGSNIADGTSWDGNANVGVRVVWGGQVALGQLRTVTGICSSFKNGPQVCRLVYSTDPSNAWTAYNDVVYSSTAGYNHPPLQPNVTTYNIGSGSPGPSSGRLKDFTTGADTGVTATLSQSGGVTWQPDGSSPNYSGGADCNPGTDAYNTFNATTASLVGVVYYGSAGWYVDLVFTGFDPSKTYEFATSANRHNATYTDRFTKYTISGADAFTNSSTSGVTIGGGGASSTLLTGYNTVNGYVARWTGIRSGTDGSFSVRAEAGGSQYKAYAFSAFKLVQTP